MEIAVIVPFFQRTEGVLRRTLTSIARQAVSQHVRVNVFVVDDSSPVQAQGELSGIDWPDSFRIQILNRSNGGPGAARNTGLSALTSESHIAFIDSDDEWLPHHLSDAADAFARGYDLFLADWRFGAADETGRTRFYPLGLPLRPLGDSTFAFELAGPLAVQTVNGPICRTGAAVFTREIVGDTRFDESLRTAGEDGLFATLIAVKTPKVLVSTKVNLILGKGINIFTAGDWGSIESYRRSLYFHRSRLLMRPLVAQLAEPSSQLEAALVQARLDLTRCALSQFRRGRFPLADLAAAFCRDPSIVGTVLNLVVRRLFQP